MSLPRRTPPSQMICSRSPTASATGATRRTGAGAAVELAAAVVGQGDGLHPGVGGDGRRRRPIWIPLMTIGPPHTVRIQSRSRQDRPGSNWELM